MNLRRAHPSRARARARAREPVVALINVVFLLLVFFLVAGTLAPPLAHDLRLVRTADLAAAPPPDALVVDAGGRVTFRGAPVTSVAAHVAGLDPEARARVRIVPDRDLPARDLVALGQILRAAGARRVVIVTERGLP